MWGLPQRQNARRADKIRLCGHLRRYKKIVKKTYIIWRKWYSIFNKNRRFLYYIYDKNIVILALSEYDANIDELLRQESLEGLKPKDETYFNE